MQRALITFNLTLMLKVREIQTWKDIPEIHEIPEIQTWKGI